MEKIAKQNYLNTKFVLDNLKRQQKTILTHKVTFTGFDRLGYEKDVMIKEYYDTPDFFLQERGLTVNRNVVKGKKTCELVVRFDTERERIKFISNIPDTFSIEIPTKASIYNYTEFIAESISELVPSGISVDLTQLANSIIKVCTLTKNRETFRFINIVGLKPNFSFVSMKMESHISRDKDTIDMLEVTCYEQAKVDDYNAFIKKLSFNNPTLIKLPTSDMDIARESLFKNLNPEGKK